MKRASLRYVGDIRIRELLRAHDCPTPFHAVRTRFLGNIATPRLDASPIETIKEVVSFPSLKTRAMPMPSYRGS